MPTIADQKTELSGQIVSIIMARWRNLPLEKKDEVTHSLAWKACKSATLDQLKEWRYHIDPFWTP